MAAATEGWDFLDQYFKDHKYPFTQHHIDSFREFLRTHVPETIRSYNPITMIKNKDDGKTPILKVDLYVGGRDGKAIFIDRPVLYDTDQTPMILTPQEARLRNLTYQTHLHADITVEITEGTAPAPTTTKTFPRVLLGALPMMVHSDACILHRQGPLVLRAFGECPNDTGGYFIIDGKEKVIVSQERITTNRLFVMPPLTPTQDPNFSHKASIRCTGETGETSLSPRTVEFFLVRNPDTMLEPNTTDEFRLQKGAILVSLPSIKGKIPLATLFRALGVESDKAILESIVGPLDDPANPIPQAFMDFLRPSLTSPHFQRPSKRSNAASAAAAAAAADADDIAAGDAPNPSDSIVPNAIFSQKDALEYLRKRVFYESTFHVKTLLVTDIFPNITGPFANKARFLGYLVQQFMKTVLGIFPPSDRDSYIFKRVDISGFLLAQLFLDTYNRFRKNARNMLDREYNYGPWKNTGNIGDIVSTSNMHRLLNSVLISEIFQRSMKVSWGPPSDDPEQGRVQDLARISYIGYMSHMRRVNLPLDRSVKIRSPHQLHTQQWGVMCPFESPDGASIGYLKNFALLTQITFGTDPAPIRAALRDLDVVPLEHLSANQVMRPGVYTRVFVNGDWFGMTGNPMELTKKFRLLRRNGLINPFTSVSWDIKANDIRVLTDAGRPCRPLLIARSPSAAPAASAAPGASWYDWLFGQSRPKSERTEALYHQSFYLSPEELALSWEDLEAKQGIIEYLDIEEENTMLIAMEAAGTTSPDRPPTHQEIHPSTIFSVVTNNIPFANHNFAPRNCFYGAQSKQAIGIYHTNFSRRFDTMSYIQHYPQKPLITTTPSHYTGNDRMPNGVNCIVAVATYTGFNQEDGIIINKTAVDRGLFHITAYKTLTATEKIDSEHDKIIFANPIKLRDAGKEVRGIKHADYTLLEDSGIISENSYIPRGQKAVVLGMVHVQDQVANESTGVFTKQVLKRTYTDVSKFTDVHHYGKIDRVFLGTKGLGTQDPQRIAKVRFRKVRRPELGDKSCCYDEQTEVLTDCGWISFKNLSATYHKVATLDEGRTLKYVTPSRVFEYHHDGMMARIKTEELDLNITPNHNIYFAPVSDPPLPSHPTEQMSALTRPLPKPSDFQFKEVQYAGTQQTSRLAFRRNAPHYGNGNGNGTESLNNLDDLISKLANVHMRSELAQGMPEWVWGLSMTDARKVLAAFADQALADMAERPADGEQDTYPASTIILTSYKLFADDLQRLALHAGASATIQQEGINYIITLNESPLSNYPTLEARNDIQWLPYKGQVYCCETPSTAGLVYVRRNGKAVWCGNSRYAQKGVFGMILPAHAMPFSKDGIIPDLIINPHAFPSRMTVAHLMECVFAKLCAMKGAIGDGTVFSPVDLQKIMEDLEGSSATAPSTTGFHRYGSEVLYNGRTGEQIQTDIFMGPTFYLRLKHMVTDKIHARGGIHTADGVGAERREQLTHQPTSGRSKGGGLRLGEMERDVVLAHGMANFTKEAMSEKSDGFTWGVCRQCGTMARMSPSIRPSMRPPPMCQNCGGTQEIAVIKTPYAFKLLVQELEAMCIQPRISSEPFPESDSDSDSDSDSGSGSDYSDNADSFDEGSEADPDYSADGGMEQLPKNPFWPSAGTKATDTTNGPSPAEKAEEEKREAEAARQAEEEAAKAAEDAKAVQQGANNTAIDAINSIGDDDPLLPPPPKELILSEPQEVDEPTQPFDSGKTTQRIDDDNKEPRQSGGSDVKTLFIRGGKYELPTKPGMVGADADETSGGDGDSDSDDFFGGGDD